MRFAPLALFLLLGCGGSVESRQQDPQPTDTPAGVPTRAPQPAPPPPTLGPLPPPADPSTSGNCGDVGGKIHGVATCVSVDRVSLVVKPEALRAPRPNVNQSLDCSTGTPMVLTTMTVRFECTVSDDSLQKHVVVALVVVDDTQHPDLNGKRIVLDEHDGFWDFIHVWTGERATKTEITIDYMVLD